MVWVSFIYHYTSSIQYFYSINFRCLHILACLPVWVTLAVSDSLWPHGWQPARLLCPWDSPGKKTAVGHRALLQGFFPTQGLNPCLLPMSPAFTGGFFTTKTTCWWWFSRQVMPNSCDPMDCSCQAPLSMGFSRQECWSGLPFPSPGNLPNPGIESGSPALQADSSPTKL